MSAPYVGNKIQLTRDKFTLVDKEDFLFLNQWKWFYDANGYAVRDQHVRMDGKKEVKKRIYMHRLIMDFPEGKVIDHINRDKLDNRKANLRICTRSLNNVNCYPHKNNKSGYPGVHLDKSRGKWMAYGSVNYKTKFLGRFTDIKDAINARQEFMKEHFNQVILEDKK